MRRATREAGIKFSRQRRRLRYAAAEMGALGVQAGLANFSRSELKEQAL